MELAKQLESIDKKEEKNETRFEKTQSLNTQAKKDYIILAMLAAVRKAYNMMKDEIKKISIY